MEILAIFSEDGFPQSFYSADIHGDDIPAEAVSITQSQWLEFISNPGRRQWRDGEIIEYVAPSAPLPAVIPIPRLGFWLAAAEIGVTKAGVKAHIDAMPEGVEKQQAIVYFEDAQLYRRTDPLLNQMAELENITQSQLDDLWAWALANYA